MNRIFFIFPGRRRIHAAARWRVQAHDDPRAERSREMQLWLETGDNRQTYDRVDQAWATLEAHASAPEMLALRHEALRRTARGGRPWLRPYLKFAVAAAAAACLLVIGAIAVTPLVESSKPVNSVVYATGPGQRRIVVLRDTSRVWLDSASAIRVQDFDRHARKLWLIKGRARFDVAHDKTRPFEVAAGRQTAIAVGTSFDVEQLNAKILVTVREGRVRVNALPNGANRPLPLFLDPGQELVATKEGGVAVSRVDLLAANGWVKGKVVLNDVRLDDAVGRMNRYLDHPLLVNPEIAGIRVSGIFNAGDLRSFVSAVTTYFPIQSATSANGAVLLEKRG